MCFPLPASSSLTFSFSSSPLPVSSSSPQYPLKQNKQTPKKRKVKKKKKNLCFHCGFTYVFNLRGADMVEAINPEVWVMLQWDLQSPVGRQGGSGRGGGAPRGGCPQRPPPGAPGGLLRPLLCIRLLTGRASQNKIKINFPVTARRVPGWPAPVLTPHPRGVPTCCPTAALPLVTRTSISGFISSREAWGSLRWVSMSTFTEIQTFDFLKGSLTSATTSLEGQRIFSQGLKKKD